MKKVLATSWHPGGANAIVPVIRALLEEDKVEITVIGYEFSEKIFDAADIAFKTIKDFGLQDVSRESMRLLINQIKPDLVLTGSALQEGKGIDVIEQTLTLAARDLGIKSLAVLDVWAEYVPRFSDERMGQQLDVLPDRIAVMDQFAVEEMLALGFPADKLVVTGNPHFDKLPEVSEQFGAKQRSKIRNHLSIPARSLFFFIAGNVFESERAQYGYWDLDNINLIIKFLQNTPSQEVFVAARLHPRMPEHDLSQIATAVDRSGLSDKIRLVRDINSQQLSLAADLTIVGFSTMGIEAVYMRRPCISLQPGLTGKDQLVISRTGVIPVGYSETACLDILSSSTDEQFRNALLAQSSSFSNDGMATRRVRDLVYSLVQ